MASIAGSSTALGEEEIKKVAAYVPHCLLCLFRCMNDQKFFESQTPCTHKFTAIDRYPNVHEARIQLHRAWREEIRFNSYAGAVGSEIYLSDEDPEDPNLDVHSDARDCILSRIAKYLPNGKKGIVNAWFKLHDCKHHYYHEDENELSIHGNGPVSSGVNERGKRFVAENDPFGAQYYFPHSEYNSKVEKRADVDDNWTTKMNLNLNTDKLSDDDEYEEPTVTDEETVAEDARTVQNCVDDVTAEAECTVQLLTNAAKTTTGITGALAQATATLQSANKALEEAVKVCEKAKSLAQAKKAVVAAEKAAEKAVKQAATAAKKAEHRAAEKAAVEEAAAALARQK